MISKTDANLDHKELAKVIPGAHHDCIVILDDNRSVWHKYENNLIQVVPYYHYNEEKKTERIINLRADNYLHYLGAFLTRACGIAQRLVDAGKKVQIQKIVRKMHDRVFQRKVVAFTSVFPKGTNPLTEREARLIVRRGGKVVKTLDESTLGKVTSVITKSFKSKKN